MSSLEVTHNLNPGRGLLDWGSWLSNLISPSLYCHLIAPSQYCYFNCAIPKLGCYSTIIIIIAYNPPCLYCDIIAPFLYCDLLASFLYCYIIAALLYSDLIAPFLYCDIIAPLDHNIGRTQLYHSIM